MNKYSLLHFTDEVTAQVATITEVEAESPAEACNKLCSQISISNACIISATLIVPKANCIRLDAKGKPIELH